MNASSLADVGERRLLALPPAELAGLLHRLGRLRVRTSSGPVCIEQVGRFPDSDDVAEAGLVLGPDGLDLRLNLRTWHCALIGHEDDSAAFVLALYDRSGEIVLQLASTADSVPEQWRALFARGERKRPRFAAREPFAGREAQAPGLLEEWAAMGNVHEHFPLLRRHGVSRHEANRLVSPRFARRLADTCAVTLVERLAESGLELMAFVSSPGCTQIYTGRLGLVDVADGCASLRIAAGEEHAKTLLRVDGRSRLELWRVHKPTLEGGVTSLEGFDAEQRLVLQFFARRAAGEPEQPAWRAWLDSLEAGA